MTNVKVSHGDLPGVSSAKSEAITPGSKPVDSDDMQVHFSTGRDRQSFKGSRLSFWCIQAGIQKGSAFLSSLSVKKAEIQSSYEADMKAVNSERKRILLWKNALDQRSAVNRSRRRVALSETPKLSYLRARKTCGKRGCYAEVYRDNECYTHYMKTVGKDPRGVSSS